MMTWRVAVLGVGLMGGAMVERLAAMGVSVIAYNRTAAKLETLRQKQIPVTDNVAEAVDKADAVILTLSDSEAIRQVILNSSVNLHNKTVIQMGTISPAESQQLATQIQAAGGDYLEAPVLGSTPEAKNGTLLVMVGATPTQFNQWQPLLRFFGENPIFVGEVGKAAALKLALNQMIAGLTATFALSLSYIQYQQVDVDVFMTILRQSALYAPTFDKKLNRMCQRNFANPNFPTKHLLKDIRLFLSSCENLPVDTTILQAVEAVVQKTVEAGEGDNDYSAIINTISGS
ncbi:MAG TPA: NAD(P)-dependent oxidoreductase [Geminocystis sp. M7585_C2015_104]|nr:NAD(P)-dependent oxidoreductase [Geminocystis sp. M7585_C2015_104]